MRAPIIHFLTQADFKHLKPLNNNMVRETDDLGLKALKAHRRNKNLLENHASKQLKREVSWS